MDIFFQLLIYYFIDLIDHRLDCGTCGWNRVFCCCLLGHNSLLYSKMGILYNVSFVFGMKIFYDQIVHAKCREIGEIVAIKKVLQEKRYKNREL